MVEKLLNYVNGEWREPQGASVLNVPNPATNEVIATVPLSSAETVDEAARLALAAFPAWRRTPATARIQHLFKLKALMEENFEDLARSITLENGKVLDDARGEMRRAIENVEVACGIPMMMMGDFSEDVARGVDEYMIRQPVGVAAIICPFNFPGMIPFWYLPYALACGNTVIVKPSERCPITLQKVFRLLDQVGFPKGVVHLVNGSADTVNALLDHPAISAITFVGSTPVARHIYSRAAANAILARNRGIIASFSRALTEGLSAQQSDAEFDAVLGEAIASIHAASVAG